MNYSFIYFKNNLINAFLGDWGLGIGDWGLGIGPNPQSPIPNPQSPIPKIYFIIKKIKNKINLIFLIE